MVQKVKTLWTYPESAFKPTEGYQDKERKKRVGREIMGDPVKLTLEGKGDDGEEMEGSRHPWQGGD